MPRSTTIQPNAAEAIDTYIANGANATQNFGSQTILNAGNIRIGLIDSAMRTLIRFDLSSFPAGTQFQSAALTLTESGTASSQFSIPSTWTVYRLTRTNWSHLTATWNKYDGTNDWTTSGGDYTTANSDTCELSAITEDLVFNGMAGMLQDAFDNDLSQLDLVVIGPETTGSSQFHQSESGHYAGSSSRPSLTVTVYPIVEQIARKILSRLEAVTTGNGYNQTFSAERPLRKGVQNLLGFRAFVTQAAEARMVAIEQGNPGTVTWQQDYYVTILIAPPDDDTTPVDTVSNLAAADAETAITDSGSDEWSQFGGLALYAEQTGRDIVNDGNESNVRLTYSVTYRTPENDPYTAR